MFITRMKKDLMFYLFISPWIIGFLAFFVGPALVSLVYSFAEYNSITPPEWVGFKNYIGLLSDSVFLKSLFNTLFFVLIGTPLVVAFQIATAMILNVELKGVNIFRTLYYLPYLVPMVATVIIWIIIFGQSGIVNQLLGFVGLGPFEWIESEHLIKPIIITMGMWASGSGILIFLAGLKGIPTQLYEAARIDGAGMIKQFFHITLPMLTPTILFSVVMQSIVYFQMFTEAYILNRGGPNYSSTTYMLNTYNTAFRDFDFGLAMAQSWILFVIILIITLIIMRSAKKWVHY